MQRLHPRPARTPAHRRIGVLLVGALIAATAVIGSNYERLGIGPETTTTTAPSLSAAARPLHNADPAVISPHMP